MKLENFLNPKYVAILGASNDIKKVGRKILDNVLIGKNVKVFPVNLKEDKVANLKAYKRVEDLPVKNFSDLLVVISIPSTLVVDELKSIAKLGVKNFVIISAGFKEFNNGGALMEKEIEEIAKKNKLNILGPNCLGFINNIKNLNVSFSDFLPDKNIKRKNNIAFISQSGAIGSAVLDWIRDKNIGLSYFFSLGNKTVLNENDFFDFFKKDKNTDLVVAYLEEISDGPRFLESVSALAKIKPVAILKAGRTIAGSKMAMSHTGSLAGSNEVMVAALERSGAIILDNVSQLYNIMKMVKEPLKVDSNKVAIVSNAGGPSVLSADEVFEKNLELLSFSKETKERLKINLSSLVHINNPLDILGDADSLRYKNSLEAVLSDKKTNSVLVLLTLQSVTDAVNIAREIVLIKNKYKNKLIVTCFLGGKGLLDAKNILSESLIPDFNSPEEAIWSLSKILNYYKERKSLRLYKQEKTKRNHNLSGEFLVDYVDSFNFFEENGLNVVKTRKLSKNNLSKIKYPIVIKYTGPDFIHKSDKKAIFLNVKNQEEAEIILDKVLKDKDLGLISDENYAVYQEMIKPDSELILGLKNDSTFGHVIMFGLGGIYTEILKDVSFSFLDINKKDAINMIKSIKAFPILKGARSQKGVDIDLLASFIVKFAKAVKENPEISEIDLNPVFISNGDIKIADVRIVF
ncbi:MAG: acetate--CoA ligase family protein [Patescibacteria group bacterium]